MRTRTRYATGRVPELSRACGAGALAVAEGETDLAVHWGLCPARNPSSQVELC